MGVATVYRHEVKGLKEFNKYLNTLGVPDAWIADAMNKIGQPVATEIQALAPRKTGAMAASVKVNKAKNELRITVGSAKVRQAYPFHAIKLSKSKGYFSALYKTKAGRKGYLRTYKLRDYPFAYIAAVNKQKEVLDAYVEAMDAVQRSAPPATAVI